MNIQQILQNFDPDSTAVQYMKTLEEKYHNLELTVFMEKMQEMKWPMWTDRAWSKKRFELCGPRIPKEMAMQVAADYNWPNVGDSFGPLCCYNAKHHAPNNYGAFHLDGKVGLYGTTWDAYDIGYTALDAALNLISNYPQIEFAVFFAGGCLAKTAGEEKEARKEFEIRIWDAEYGFRYDPRKKQLDILEGRSAWRAVRAYQALYTKKERELFFPWASQEYYDQNPEGKTALLEFAEFEKTCTSKRTGTLAEMPLQEYRKIVMSGYEETKEDYPPSMEDFCIQCDGLELTVFTEDPEYMKFSWLSSTGCARRPYFEMCGPKIPRQKAMQMAHDYQWSKCQTLDFGLMACYNDNHHFPDNYGLFKLNGNIGLNGICWKWNRYLEVVCAILYMIRNYPDFEFAVAISDWDEVPPETYWYPDFDKPIRLATWEYHLQPKDVDFGFAYSPSQNILKILGPQSAWEAVKQYQKEYTQEEQKLFDPDESSYYYEENPEGKAELEEFIEYERKSHAESEKANEFGQT